MEKFLFNKDIRAE